MLQERKSTQSEEENHNQPFQKNEHLNKSILADLQKSLALLDQKSWSKMTEEINFEIQENQRLPDYELLLKRINKIVSTHLERMRLVERQGLPLDTAWFFWKFSKWDRMVFHYQEPSDQAWRLSHLAQIAIRVTNRIIVKGGTSDVKNNVLTFNEWQNKLNEFTLMREAAKQLYQRLNYASQDFFSLSLKAATITKIAEATQLGSCGEKTWVLTNFLRKIGLENLGVRVEHLYIMKNEGMIQKQGNHTLTVWGRNINSDLNDYTTWGDAILSDPWSGKQYFAKDLPKFLTDCLQVQYQCALLPKSDFKPAVNKIYFQKQGDDLNYYYTDIKGLFRKKTMMDIDIPDPLTIENIIPIFDRVLIKLANQNRIFREVMVRNYEIPFHPFANSLELIDDDGIATLKKGLDIIHSVPFLGLEHGLNTHNLNLIEQSFKNILDDGLDINWEIFESLDQNFKRLCFEKLITLALEKEVNSVALKLLNDGYGTTAQIARIPELESNSSIIEAYSGNEEIQDFPNLNGSSEEDQEGTDEDGENTLTYITRTR